MAVDEAQEIVEHKSSNSNGHIHSNGNQQRNALDLSHHLSAESVARRPSPLKEAALYMKNPNLISLGGGLPDPTYFPFEQLKATVPAVGHWDDNTMQVIEIEKKSKPTEVTFDLSVALQYSQGTGRPELLKFIREHTEMVHHPPYADWTCLMTAGNTNGLDTCFRMLCSRGDRYLIEEHSFCSAVECAHPQGLEPVTVPLDDGGIIVESMDQMLTAWDVSKDGKKPKVLYTIPTGQNPTGSTLSLERRKSLYQVCQKHDLIIMEDEPYYFLQMQPYTGINSPDEPLPKTSSEFLSALVPSLLSLDVDGRVVRLDSFSKVIAPGCRTGWLTGSNQLMERALRSNEVSIQSPSGFSQVVINALLNSWGHAGYLNWLVHIRSEYTIRRNALLGAMEQYLPRDLCSWTPPAAGMFIWIKIAAKKHPQYEELGVQALEKKIFLTAIEKEVLVAMGSWFIVDKDMSDPGLYFRATFAAASAEKMEIATQRFGDALRSEFQANSGSTSVTPLE